jgi:hypothetical protein
MARKGSSFGSFGARPFGSKSPKAPKPKEPPVPRNPGFENLLCEAIRARVLVMLRYKDDPGDRVFAPHAVFHSTQDKVCVSGTQVDNPAKFGDDNEPHFFEIGKIKTLSLTKREFEPYPWFDSSQDHYRNGVICSVDRP